MRHVERTAEVQNVRTRGAGIAGVLGLCLVAVLAIAAVAATSASAALPEWGACEASPTHEGRYADSNCLQPVAKVYKKYTGGYEWNNWEHALEGRGLSSYGFKNGAIGPTTFEATNGKKIECHGYNEEGEQSYLRVARIDGAKEVGRVLVYFYGCESDGQVCSSEFEELGSITDELEWLNSEGFKGELTYLSGRGTATPTVGLTLTAAKKGAPLFTVVCEGGIGTVTIGGAGGKKEERAKGNTVISLIEPVDQMTGEYTQTFTQAAGVQNPTAPQTGGEKTLQMYQSNENRWFQMGISSTFHDPAEEGEPPTEIKAAL